MKLKLTKDWKVTHRKTIPKGREVNVTRELAEQLMIKKIAKPVRENKILELLKKKPKPEEEDKKVKGGDEEKLTITDKDYKGN